jgi:hypothetical protein
MFDMSTPKGGSAWGAGTLAGPDGSRKPSEDELAYAAHQVGAGAGAGAGAGGQQIGEPVALGVRPLACGACRSAAARQVRPRAARAQHPLAPAPTPASAAAGQAPRPDHQETDRLMTF